MSEVPLQRASQLFERVGSRARERTWWIMERISSEFGGLATGPFGSMSKKSCSRVARISLDGISKT